MRGNGVIHSVVSPLWMGDNSLLLALLADLAKV